MKQDNARFERVARIARAFSPSAPILRRELAGRAGQINELANACMQRGQHVVVYGERGAGKTSLVNALIHLFGTQFDTPESGAFNCDHTTTFAALWRAILSDIPLPRAGHAGDPRNATVRDGTLAQFLPEVITPDAVRMVLQRRKGLLIVIDEIDRIRDRSTTTLLADTIKNLSDHCVDVTLILVGVAERFDALITEHDSVQRALVPIHLPRMSRAELGAIIDVGFQECGLAIEPAARQRIITLSQGLPYYTHLLSMHSAHAAVAADRPTVTLEDTQKSLKRMLRDTRHAIERDFHHATSSDRATRYPEVLLACSLAGIDAHGYFTAGDVAKAMAVIAGHPCESASFLKHLGGLCEHRRGPALERIDTPRGYKYRFRNALLRAYVIMQGLEGGVIADETLGQVTP